MPHREAPGARVDVPPDTWAWTALARCHADYAIIHGPNAEALGRWLATAGRCTVVRCVDADDAESAARALALPTDRLLAVHGGILVIARRRLTADAARAMAASS